MDPEALRPLLDSIGRSSSARGFDAGFTGRVRDAALGTADAEAALARLANLFSVVEEPGFYSLLCDPDGIRSLLTVLGYSGFLSSLIQRSPGDYVWLFRQAGLFSTRTAAVMEADLTSRLDPGMDAADVARALRAAKYREMLRIGVKDLLGAAPLQETVREISALAEAAIDAAVAASWDILRRRHGVPLQETGHAMTRPARFCVLGMGKLGGEELNYSSDVDLYYLYSHHAGRTTGRPTPAGGFAESVENHTFFVRLGEMVTRLVGDRTGDGIVFRVDMRLRPEGESGELAYSLPSLETYYQSWGRMVDRLALLKARPVGGDRRLGEEFLRRMSPFVWTRHLDYTALDEIGALKQRIDRHGGEPEDPGPAGLRNIKLGRGGIREAEFVVQSLQLVHGGRTPALRERNTLRAVARLSENGLLSERDAVVLSQGYSFLRAAEHRLQLVEERQTQELPRDPAALARLAHTMGFPREGGGGDSQAFLAALGRVSGEVHAVFSRTFGGGKEAEQAPGAELPSLLREELPRDEAERELAALGFSDPASAYASLLLLRDGPPYSHFSDSSRRLLRQIAPGLVAELANSPDPDAVLAHLARFIAKVGARTSYFELLARNPRSIHLLAALFGSSPYLSGILMRQPDLLDMMVGGEGLAEGKDAGAFAEEARGAVAASPSFEDALNALRRYRNAEFLRVGLGDLLGFREVEAVNAELSLLADSLLAESLRLACRELGRGPECLEGFAVAAFGKLGGREMSYGSDLDLVFVHGGGDDEFYSRLGQRALAILTSATGEGVLYPIDMRLRPSGHQGPLVVSREAFLRYHESEGQPWEHQALVKGRVVAGGGPGFVSQVAEDLQALAYGRRLTAVELAEIARVRARMEEELAEEASGPWWDLKVGPGGLVDVEFAVQVLQLLHGPDHPGVRTPSTPEALSSLAQSGLLDESGYNTLSRAYRFYRGIEGRQRIHSDRPDPRVPRDPAKLVPLARRLGYPGRIEAGERLAKEIARTREETRRAYQAVMAGAAASLKEG